MELNLENLSGKCNCGREHVIKTKIVIIDSGATNRLRDVVDRLNLPHGGCVICDGNTRRYADNAADKLVSRIDKANPVIMLDSQELRADDKSIGAIESTLPEGVTWLVAAGSGTIHDITRRIAKNRGIPFISYPTACSGGGFAEDVCSRLGRGFRGSIPGVAPAAIVADTEVFTSAPYRLTASGICDILGKYTALADWKCGRLMINEDFCDNIYSIISGAVASVREYMPAIHAGESDAYEKLILALIMCGITTQMWGDSRPVSGSEYHLSRFWEMGIINNASDSLYGERVGVGLLIALRNYEKVYSLERIERYIQPYAGMDLPYLRKKLGGSYEDMLKANQPDPLRTISIEKMVDSFQDLKEIIKDLPGARSLRPFMLAAGCVTTIEEIGLTRDILPDSLILAPFVNRRLTIMRTAKLLPM